MAALEFLYRRKLVVLSRRKVHLFVLKMGVRGQADGNHRWVRALNFKAASQAPGPAVQSNSWCRIPAPVACALPVRADHRKSRWSAIFFGLPKTALEGSHLPRWSEEPTCSPRQGLGWQKVLGRAAFPVLFPFASQALRTWFFPWYSFKKIQPDWSEICKSVLSYPHRTSGIQSLLPRLLHSIIF